MTTKKTKITGAEYFSIAFKAYTETLPYGSQQIIAKKIGRDKTYLNQFIKGKKIVSEKIREQLADYIGIEYGELIMLGKKILDKEKNKNRSLPKDFGQNVIKPLREKYDISSKAAGNFIGVPESEYIYKENGSFYFTFAEVSDFFRGLDSLAYSFFSSKIDKEKIAAVAGQFKEKIKEWSEEERKALHEFLFDEKNKVSYLGVISDKI